MTKVNLRFHASELVQTEFEHPLLSETLISTRGKAVGAINWELVN